MPQFWGARFTGNTRLCHLCGSAFVLRLFFAQASALGRATRCCTTEHMLGGPALFNKQLLQAIFDSSKHKSGPFLRRGGYGQSVPFCHAIRSSPPLSPQRLGVCRVQKNMICMHTRLCRPLLESETALVCTELGNEAQHSGQRSVGDPATHGSIGTLPHRQ